MKARRSQVWRLSVLLVVALAVVTAGTLLAQTTDPLVGTWKLNVAKSKYTGAAPKSQTVKIEGTDQARKVTVDVTPATGPDQHWEVMGGPGKDAPVVGNNPNADAYVFKQINANTLEAQYKKGGKATILQTAVVSADGKTLTVTGTGMSAAGQSVNNVAVYDK
jgi:hypothetical protein